MSDHDHDGQVAAYGLCRECAIRDAAEAKAAADAAIARVEEAAPGEWLAAARAVVVGLAAHVRFLTSDDVWARLAHPPEPRALGAVMRQLAEEGVLRPTGRVQPSTRPECHARPVAVWEAVRPQPRPQAVEEPLF